MSSSDPSPKDNFTPTTTPILPHTDPISISILPAQTSTLPPLQQPPHSDPTTTSSPQPQAPPPQTSSPTPYLQLNVQSAVPTPSIPFFTKATLSPLPDPVIPSLQDDITASNKFVHHNMFLTQSHLSYTPTYPLNITPPPGSYLVATPRGHNTPYLRGTLVVPDGTDIPTLKQSLLSQSLSQHNAYHYPLTPISQVVLSPYQNRFSNEYLFHRTLFDGFKNPDLGQIKQKMAHNGLQGKPVLQLLYPSKTPGMYHAGPYHTPKETENGEKGNTNYPQPGILNRFDQFVLTQAHVPISPFKVHLNQLLRRLDEGTSTGFAIRTDQYDENDIRTISQTQTALQNNPNNPENHNYSTKLVSIEYGEHPIPSYTDANSDQDKIPIYGLNVPTVIISQYNSSPEQQILKFLPLSVLAAGVAFRYINKSTAFQRSELHSYLAQPTLAPLALQKAIAVSLGYATKLRTSILSLGLIPLIEIPLVSACLLPMWGNISNQLGNTTVPYHGVVDQVKILTETEHKNQFLRQYHQLFDFPASDDDEKLFLTQNEQVGEITGTDKNDTTTKTSTQQQSSKTPQSTAYLNPTTPLAPIPSFPGITKAQLNTILEKTLKTTATGSSTTSQTSFTPSIETIPSKLTPGQKLYHKFLKFQQLDHYSPYPFINERLDDENNISINNTLKSALQVPTPSASSVNITPWRQATSIERMIVGGLFAMVAARWLVGKQIKPVLLRYRSYLYQNNQALGNDAITSSPLGVALNGLRSRHRTATQGQVAETAQFVSGSEQITTNTTTSAAIHHTNLKNGTEMTYQNTPEAKALGLSQHVRHIIPQLYPTFRFSRINLPYTQTSPIDHPSALKLAHNVKKIDPLSNFPLSSSSSSSTSATAQIEAPPTLLASHQYSLSYVDRSFGQGQAMVGDSVKMSKIASLLRISLLTAGLVRFTPGKWTTEEFEYLNRYNPLSGRYLYDIEASRDWDIDKNDTTTTAPPDQSQSTATTASITATTTSTPTTNPIEKAHTLFTASNSYPTTPLLAIFAYTALLILEINTRHKNGYRTLLDHEPVNIPLQLSKLATNESYRHPPTITTSLNGYQHVFPTPTKIKELLEPILTLQTKTLQLIEWRRRDTATATGGNGGGLTSAPIQLKTSDQSPPTTSNLFHRLGQLGKKNLRLLIPLTLIWITTKYCWLPTHDFIKGNNNGPHPFSEHLFAKTIAKDSVEVEVQSILNVLRHNGIQNLFHAPPTVDQVHPAATHHHVSENTSEKVHVDTLGDENKTVTRPSFILPPSPHAHRIPVTMIQIGYKRDKSQMATFTDKVEKKCKEWYKAFQTWKSGRAGGGGGGGGGGKGGEDGGDE